MTTVIAYHKSCPDGFSSAWVLLQGYPNARLHPASYGDPIPDDIDDADLHVVDFCYEPHQLAEIMDRASTCTILDHHHTAAGWLEQSDFLVFDSVAEYADSPIEVGTAFIAVMDQKHSGVGIAMQWTNSHWSVFDRIEDRDLWRFALRDTKDVFAAVTSRPYTVEAWDGIVATPLADLVTEGRAISRYRDKLIEDTLETAFRAVIPTGHEVWCVASPYAIGSDVAGILAGRSDERWAAYFVPSAGKVRFGLRASDDGPDVAEIAAICGGGGHKQASGFEVESWNQ